MAVIEIAAKMLAFAIVIWTVGLGAVYLRQLFSQEEPERLDRDVLAIFKEGAADKSSPPEHRRKMRRAWLRGLWDRHRPLVEVAMHLGAAYCAGAPVRSELEMVPALAWLGAALAIEAILITRYVLLIRRTPKSAAELELPDNSDLLDEGLLDDNSDDPVDRERRWE